MTHDSETTVRAVRPLAGFQYAQAAFAATTDLTMPGMLATRERTAGDWQRMPAAAGFRRRDHAKETTRP